MNFLTRPLLVSVNSRLAASPVLPECFFNSPVLHTERQQRELFLVLKVNVWIGSFFRGFTLNETLVIVEEDDFSSTLLM